MIRTFVCFFAVLLGIPALLQAQKPVRIVIPQKNPLANPGTCYWRATHFYANDNLLPGPSLTQATTGGLGPDESLCIDYFFTAADTTALVDARDAVLRKKIDEVKTSYVDKISELPKEVLDAIRVELKQQVIAELLPELREQIRKELEQQRSKEKGAEPLQKVQPKPRAPGNSK
jgi:hypothetical protein